MDIKTWQQNNSGSTSTGRSLQGIRHQQLSSTPTATIYSGSLSTINNQSPTHWQRISCCNGSTATPNSSHNHLLSSRQQFSGNQISQQRQPTQLRYFQFQKSTNPQYSSRSSPVASSSRDRQNATHPNIPHAYAYPATQSALPPPTGPSVPEGFRHCSRDIVSFVNQRVANSFQSKNTLPTIPQTHPRTSTEEPTILHHPQNNNDNNINVSSANKNVNKKNSSIFGGTCHHPIYHVFASGHFAPLPALTESLTARSALSGATLDASGIVFGPCASSTPVDDPPRDPEDVVTPTPGPLSLSGFVNVFETVPDMMENARPGPNLFAPYPADPPFVFPFTYQEFSYHVVKPTPNVERNSSILNPSEIHRSDNCQKFSLKKNRANCSSSRYRSVSAITGSKDNLMWKNVTNVNYSKEKFLRLTSRRLSKQVNCSSTVRKSYAAVVQVTRSCKMAGFEDIKITGEFASLLSKMEELPEIAANVERYSSSGPAIAEVPEAAEYVEVESSPEPAIADVPEVEDNVEIESAAVPAIPEVPEVADNVEVESSGEPAIVKVPEIVDNVEIESAGAPAIPEDPKITRAKEAIVAAVSAAIRMEKLAELRGATLKRDRSHSARGPLFGGPVKGRIREVSRRPTFPRNAGFPGTEKTIAIPAPVEEDIAETRRKAQEFCLETCEKGPILGLFQLWCQTQRRMEYTKFSAPEDPPSPKPSVTNTVSSSDSNVRRTTSTIGQRPLYSTVVEGNGPVRGPALNGNAGATQQYKVLQKVRVCPDGNGAIYANSWRPQEIHYIRRFF